jgi:hypothetical protein
MYQTPAPRIRKGGVKLQHQYSLNFGPRLFVLKVRGLREAFLLCQKKKFTRHYKICLSRIMVYYSVGPANNRSSVLSLGLFLILVHFYYCK